MTNAILSNCCLLFSIRQTPAISPTTEPGANRNPLLLLFQSWFLLRPPPTATHRCSHRCPAPSWLSSITSIFSQPVPPPTLVSLTLLPLPSSLVNTPSGLNISPLFQNFPVPILTISCPSPLRLPSPSPPFSPSP